jgi:N-acetylmuramoyl-L-alanine amidase
MTCCDSKRGPQVGRLRWIAGAAALLLASLTAPQATFAQSGKKADAEKKTTAAKPKAPHAAVKPDAAPKGDAPAGKPKTEAAPDAPTPSDAAPAVPKQSEAPPNPSESKPPEPSQAEVKPASTPAPAIPDAASAAQQDAKAKPANPTPNDIVRERYQGVPAQAQPAATAQAPAGIQAPAGTQAPAATPAPAGTPSPAETHGPADAVPTPTPSLAGSPQTRAPADGVAPAAADVKPPTGETATTTDTNQPAPAGGEALPPSVSPTTTPATTEQGGETPPATPQPAQAATCNRADFRIAIDVGHTETNYGAVSAHGKPEFEFNRTLAHDLVTKLWDRGFDKADILIQTDNDLPKRARELSSRRPNLMLSLHHDSVQDRFLKPEDLDGQKRMVTHDFRGYSIFVSRENVYRDDSERFAKLLGGEMLAQKTLKPTSHHHEQENRPIIDERLGVFQYDGLVVLKQTTAPAVLLESAVITNPEDEQKANDKAYRGHITDAIADAILKFCEAGAARLQPRAAPAPLPFTPDKPGGRK